MSKTKKTRPVSAKDRTISMFTGKTDSEDPLRARDGTLPELPASVPRSRKRRDSGFKYKPGPVGQNVPLKNWRD